MIDKKDMSEEEIKLNYITPAITETWSKSCIRMEFPVTPGRIMLDGKKAKRKDAGIADYVLFYNDTSAWFPLAVVEARITITLPMAVCHRQFDMPKQWMHHLHFLPMEIHL